MFVEKLNQYTEGQIIGLKNEDNEIIASSLLLQKRLPLGYSYFYSPRGFVLDYTDEKTFSLFTKEIVKFVKAKKGIFLKRGDVHYGK